MTRRRPKRAGRAKTPSVRLDIGNRAFFTASATAVRQRNGRPPAQRTISTDSRLDDTITSVRRRRCDERLRTQALGHAALRVLTTRCRQFAGSYGRHNIKRDSPQVGESRLNRGYRWWRGQDLNLRPSGYEPDELPDCSTPRRTIDVTGTAREPQSAGLTRAIAAKEQ
jgi:hypothetical protein